MRRVRGRIARSRRQGRVALWIAVGVSVVLGLPILQAVLVALRMGRGDVILWGVVGVGILLVLDLVAWLLVRRQGRLLDAAEEVVAEIEGAQEVAGG